MRTQFSYAYARPSVTATIIPLVSHYPNFSVLCGVRGRADGAFAGHLCVPGGFLDAKVDMGDVVLTDGEGLIYPEDYDQEFEDETVKPGETVEETAQRELREETGLEIELDRFKLFHVHSDPNTDPRCHVVNVCFYVILSEEEAARAVAGDDLAELKQIDEVNFREPITMAFNHYDLTVRGIAAGRMDDWR